MDDLTALSVACVAIRLRPPRPPLRRLARQPGFAALFAMAVAMPTIWLAGHLPMASGIGWIRPDLLALVAMHGVGFAVLWSWLTLYLIGCWRPSRDWSDRIGRAAGVVAIACLLTPWIMQILIWR